ncbi:helix-turn-helix domain-containing protein [Corynebacterium mastitidis]|uniref:Helix-turn-helix domain-containing protein n=1 Tax=Corynebacterium mastitidis TaxID=161890 RepID=A0A2N0X4P5_9CORY|nr:helix-turn-helix domain-containing protein [Corynebacterium mastitidis]MCH6197923.1 helix-turn-helix domain-containing protein [Corynebacterium mastitidis]PKF67674.1 hypothetical protein CXB45_11055 [Corynebacterium mastitidis]
MDDRLFTMAQAAEVCGVAKSTIARARQAGKFPHSQQQPDGSYRIPLSDLAAAHFLDRVHGDTASQEVHKPEDATEHLHHELAQARHELALATQRAHHLQQLLDAKEESLQALRVAVKALEAAPVEAEPHAEETTPAPPQSVMGTPDNADDSPTPESPVHGSGLRRWARTLFRG